MIVGTYTPDLHDPAAVEVLLVLLEVCHILQLSEHRLQRLFGSYLHALETWGDIIPPKRRLLHMSKSALLGLLGSVAMRCIDGQVDDAAPPVAPAAGLWPRVIREAGYDELGNLQIGGIDDNERAWHEAVTGRGQEAWLLKQLYVERRFGRRNKSYSLKKRK